MKWLIKGGLFIVPFIPLYVSRSLFFPYITGKAFIFRTIVEVVFFAWLGLAFFYKEYRPKLTLLLAAIGIFMLVVAAATALGVNPAKSFWSNFERMEGLAAYLHLFAYFLVLAHVFEKKDWYTFFSLFVVSGLIENIYALFQKLGFLESPQGGFRVDGTIGNPTYLAAYLIFIAAFAIFLWLSSEKGPLKIFYGLVAVFSFLTIYFTATRGAVLALAIGGLAAGLLYLFLVKANKKVAVGLIILVVVSPVLLYLVKDAAFVKKSEVLSRFASVFAELSGKDSGSQARFYIWSMSWQGVKERPILGWGPDNYAVVFSKYYRPELYAKEPWFDRSHNIILDWLINAGVLGLLAYLGILISAVYLLWQSYRQKKVPVETTILFSALFLVYFLQNIFVFDQLATYISYFAVLAYIQNVFVSEDRSRSSKIKNNPAAGLLLVPLVLIIYFVNAKPLFANLNLLNALKVQRQDLKAAFGHYEKALAYNTLGNQEIREQLVRFAISTGESSAADVSFKDLVLRRAITEAQKGVAENRLDPRPYLFLGTILGRVSFWDEAIATLEEAVKLSPKKQQTYFELADIYIRKGDYAKAIEVMETAYQYEMRNDQARLNLIAVYILSGNQARADQLFLENYKTVNWPDYLLVQVYSRVKNYQRLIGIWQAFVKTDPHNTQYWESLAGAYLLNNQKNEAVKALQEAISLNSDFQERGETYIRQILSS